MLALREETSCCETCQSHFSVSWVAGGENMPLSDQIFALFPMVLSVSLMAVSILSEYERIVLFSSQLSISNFLSKMSC